MASGGARARSGPAKDPNSERSRAAGYKPTALPMEGYDGKAPTYPLPKIRRGAVDSEASDHLTEAFRRRELAVWRDAWSTPQACMWISQSWRWQTVAEYCRVKTAVEIDPDGNASLVSRLKEYRQEIGLSRDGLTLNGWAIAVDEVSKKRDERADDPPPAAAPTTTRRLRKQPSA